MQASPPSVLYLWNLRTLYIGELFQLSSIRHGAAALLVGITGEFELNLPGVSTPVKTRVALIPPDHTFSANSCGNIIADLFLDPCMRDFSLLKSQMDNRGGGIYFDSARSDQWLQALTDIHEQRVSPQDAYEHLRVHILSQDAIKGFTHETDSRVWQVINLIKQNPLENFPGETLAESVDMTDVQLRRLFKKHTGLPLRTYRRWHRLFVTATLMAMGKTLTDAAVETGFFDAAHFNHAFREMLGMKPSFILKNAAKMRIHYGTEQGY